MEEIIKQTDPFTNITPIDRSTAGTPVEFINAKTINIGQGGSNVFRADQSGFWTGGETFQTAKMRCDLSGNMEVASLRRKDFQWTTMFESIDGYSKTGTLVLNEGEVVIPTAATTNDYAEIKKTVGAANMFSWSKRRKIKIGVKFNEAGTGGTQIIQLVTGIAEDTLNAGRKMGFMVNGDHLYGICANGSNYETLDCGAFSIGTSYYLVAVLDPGVSVTFYVNDVEIGKLTTYVPKTSTHASRLMDISVITLENAVHSCNVSFFDFWQAS